MLERLANITNATLPVIAPGTSKAGRAPPYIVLLALVALSIIIVLGSLPWLTLCLIMLSILTAIVKRPKALVTLFILFLLFIAPFIILSTIIQLTLGVFFPAIIIAGVIKMLDLVLAGSIAVSFINIYEVILQLKNVSPSLAITVALSIKLFYTALINEGRLVEVYSVNLRTNGIMNELQRIMALSKALIYVCTSTALESMEALYTRLNMFLGD